MKILYVKNNSERAKEFQLKTIIFEQEGKKYIKKQALTSEAIPHLKKMKESYTKLTNAIVHPKLKLAPIIDETANSLTFEFIEGQSLEKKYTQVKKQSPKAQEEVLDSYIELVRTAFKTTKGNSSIIDDKAYQTLFGALDFSAIKEDEMYFDSVSNIDLILSNIIYAKENIYLIDYEWVFDVNLPINYIINRTLLMLEGVKDNPKYILNHSFLYLKMERHFVDKYVMHDGFYFQRHQYIKINAPIVKYIEGKEAHIKALVTHAQNQEKHIKSLDSAIEIRDEQISFLFKITDSLRIKSRIKKYLPQSLLKKLGFTQNTAINMQEYPLPNPEDIEGNTQIPYSYHSPQINAKIQNTLASFQCTPLISIIMPVYNVDTQWLDLAIASIEAQWYKHWELCIADDKSTNQDTLSYLKNINNPKIKVTYLDINLNISGASNTALKLATGEYIALMDNDDEISPDALYEMVKVINEKDADFIYSDEDFISMEGEFINPHFKPDFSPDLLLSHNYITHFTCFKKSLLDKVGLFDSYFDGSQDYDLFLRLTEQTSNIHHIQKVLYHWRMLETSTSANSEAKPEAIGRGRLALEATIKRRKLDATVEHANLNHYFRVKYTIKDEPLVSIIMPFKDRPELLELSINSVLKHSSYKNYEIIGIS
ncbi:MAG: glycosyltransferase [Sulfurovum sp.]|nr:glycosyltransferase [Sulfurovum sp.]